MDQPSILIPCPMHPAPVEVHQKYRPGIESLSNQLIAPCPSGTNIASVMRCNLSDQVNGKVGLSADRLETQ